LPNKKCQTYLAYGLPFWRKSLRKVGLGCLKALIAYVAM